MALINFGVHLLFFIHVAYCMSDIDSYISDVDSYTAMQNHLKMKKTDLFNTSHVMANNISQGTLPVFVGVALISETEVAQYIDMSMAFLQSLFQTIPTTEYKQPSLIQNLSAAIHDVFIPPVHYRGNTSITEHQDYQPEHKQHNSTALDAPYHNTEFEFLQPIVLPEHRFKKGRHRRIQKYPNMNI